MIISFVNQKGGVGKTTISLLVALAISNAGRKVCLLDLDPQGTATDVIGSWRQRNIANIELIQAPSSNDSIIIIDTPPRLNEVTAKAVKMSSSSFIISSPSPLDLLSSKATINFMKKHAARRLNMKILFNGIVHNSRLSRDLNTVIGQMGIKTLHNSLLRSINYQHIALDGWRALNVEQKKNASNIALEIATQS